MIGVINFLNEDLFYNNSYGLLLTNCFFEELPHHCLPRYYVGNEPYMVLQDKEGNYRVSTSNEVILPLIEFDDLEVVLRRTFPNKDCIEKQTIIVGIQNLLTRKLRYGVLIYCSDVITEFEGFNVFGERHIKENNIISCKLSELERH